MSRNIILFLHGLFVPLCLLALLRPQESFFFKFKRYFQSLLFAIDFSVKQALNIEKVFKHLKRHDRYNSVVLCTISAHNFPSCMYP